MKILIVENNLCLTSTLIKGSANHSRLWCQAIIFIKRCRVTNFHLLLIYVTEADMNPYRLRGEVQASRSRPYLLSRAYIDKKSSKEMEELNE